MMFKNIILILLDGSRYDCFNASPELNEICRRGTLFDQVIISSPYTVASIHSLFTGLYATTNGVNCYNNMFGLKDNVKLLTEYMKDEGYFTYGDIMNEAVITKRGFDELNIHDEHTIQILDHHKKILTNLSENNDDFFAFLQYSKIHTASVTKIAKKFDDLDEDYFTDEQREKNKASFYTAMEEAGSYSKEIMQHIKDLGILEDSLIVFFSDHGTSLGEKFGEKMYGSFTYDYTIKTYMLFINSNVFDSKKNQLPSPFH